MSADFSTILNIASSSIAKPLATSLIATALERPRKGNVRIEMGDKVVALQNPSEAEIGLVVGKLGEFDPTKVRREEVDEDGEIPGQQQQQQPQQPEPQQHQQDDEEADDDAAAVALIAVPPLFKLVFLTVLGISILSGLGAAGIAFAADDTLTTNQQTVFEAANTAWKMGVGAIFGLLGGKAA